MKAHFLLFSLLFLFEGCCTPGRVPGEREDKTEPTFWEMCYDVKGNPEDYAGECEDPQIVDWGSLPIRLAIDESYPGEGEAVLKAVRVWNGWLGTDVFYVTPVDPDVVVQMGELSILGPAGRADHTRRFGKLKFTVTLFGEEYANRVSIVTHELGHVLGLAHDPGRHRSVMDPGGDWYMPWITDKDCVALRRMYGLPGEEC